MCVLSNHRGLEPFPPTTYCPTKIHSGILFNGPLQIETHKVFGFCHPIDAAWIHKWKANSNTWHAVVSDDISFHQFSFPNRIEGHGFLIVYSSINILQWLMNWGYKRRWSLCTTHLRLFYYDNLSFENRSVYLTWLSKYLSVQTRLFSLMHSILHLLVGCVVHRRNSTPCIQLCC